MPVRIERLHPRNGKNELPDHSSKGYILVSPSIAKGRNKVENATFAKTMEEAADLISKGYSIRMTASGLRPSLIAPASLRVTR